jgi:hypothetical protein
MPERALEPELTAFDKRVLGALEPWPRDADAVGRVKWLSAWQVAERINEDDVALVRRTLNGLVRFRHAITGGGSPASMWTRRWDDDET